MKKALFLSCVLSVVASTPAMAVNKCVIDGWKVVYQVAPCPDAAKSSDVTIRKDTATPAAPAEADELKRIKETGAAMERERKITETEREIAERESRNHAIQQTMTNELAALKIKKTAARNNLAGATWEESISGEMNAVTQKYDTMIRTNQSKIDSLRDELEKLREKK